MLTAIFATTTAALFGVADYLGGIASRRDWAVAVTAVAHGLGVPIALIAVLAWRAEAWTVADVTWGIAAGVSGGIGVASLFAALAVGRMSVVAPITAALSGSLPAAYDLFRGTEIGSRALVGLGLALVAVVIVSAAPGSDEQGRMPAIAVGLSLVAGTGFAGGFLAFAQTATTSGLVPLLAARTTSALLLGITTLAVRRAIRLDRSALAPALGAGALDACANVTMIAAIRIGPLAVASVLGSLYPVVTILLARVFLGERLRGAQGFGVGLALVAVVLAASGVGS